jgi:hypothetical protein
MISPPVGETVNEWWIPVVRKDDRLVRCNEHVELVVAQPVRMLADGLELHRVHDVDDAHFQVREVFPQERHGGERFEGWHVSAARHDNAGAPLRSVLAHGQMPTGSA